MHVMEYLNCNYCMYTCGIRTNAKLVKEGSFRINAKLVKEELRAMGEAFGSDENKLKGDREAL